MSGSLFTTKYYVYKSTIIHFQIKMENVFDSIQIIESERLQYSRTKQ